MLFALPVTACMGTSDRAAFCRHTSRPVTQSIAGGMLGGTGRAEVPELPLLVGGVTVISTNPS